VLGQEGPDILHGPAQGGTGDTKEFGYEVVGAKFAQVEHGSQDPVGWAESVLGARSGSSAAPPTASGAPGLFPPLCQRRSQLADQGF
jgi:hypothetical protein